MEGAQVCGLNQNMGRKAVGREQREGSQGEGQEGPQGSSRTGIALVGEGSPHPL